jgi:hypothetical protein
MSRLPAAGVRSFAPLRRSDVDGRRNEWSLSFVSEIRTRSRFRKTGNFNAASVVADCSAAARQRTRSAQPRTQLCVRTLEARDFRIDFECRRMSAVSRVRPSVGYRRA